MLNAELKRILSSFEMEISKILSGGPKGCLSIA
jgi:hypothetical protein